MAQVRRGTLFALFAAVVLVVAATFVTMRWQPRAATDPVAPATPTPSRQPPPDRWDHTRWKATVQDLTTPAGQRDAVQPLDSDVQTPQFSNPSAETRRFDHDLAAILARDGKNRDEALGELMEAWAKTDRTSAGEAASLIEDSSAREAALDAVFSSWASEDARGMAAWASSALDGNDMQLAVSAAANRMSQEDPAAALSWCMATLPPEARQAGVSAVIHAWVEEDPLAVAAYVGSTGQWSLAPELSQFWAESDAQSAASWTAKIPDPTLRTQSRVQLIENWAAENPPEVRAWIQSLGVADQAEMQRVAEKAILAVEREREIRSAMPMRAADGTAE